MTTQGQSIFSNFDKQLDEIMSSLDRKVETPTVKPIQAPLIETPLSITH